MTLSKIAVLVFTVILLSLPVEAGVRRSKSVSKTTVIQTPNQSVSSAATVTQGSASAQVTSIPVPPAEAAPVPAIVGDSKPTIVESQTQVYSTPAVVYGRSHRIASTTRTASKAAGCQCGCGHRRCNCGQLLQLVEHIAAIKTVPIDPNVAPAPMP